jgi:hypothetical protein
MLHKDFTEHREEYPRALCSNLEPGHGNGEVVATGTSRYRLARHDA